MMRAILLLSLFLMLSTLPAEARAKFVQQPAPLDLAHKPPTPNLSDRKYHTCNDTTDCAAVNPPCGNLVAVNRDYAGEVQNWYDFVRPQFTCAFVPQNLSASPVCNAAHLCAMAAAGSINVPRKDNIAYCDVPDDCVLVTGKCGRKIAVNKENEDEATASAGDPNTSTCDYADERQMQSMDCKNHLCTAILQNQ